MNKRSLAYSGILLLVLVVAYVALNIRDVQGVIQNGDVNLGLADPLVGTLPPVSSEHLLGQTIKLTGALDFADQEQAIIQQVRLVATGPQGLDVLLPLQEGTFDLSNQTAATDDQLSVTVVFNSMQVIASGTLPGSTLPGGTVPGTTLPGSGEFKGIAAGANISYEINWTPPVFLTLRLYLP